MSEFLDKFKVCPCEECHKLRIVLELTGVLAEEFVACLERHEAGYGDRPYTVVLPAIQIGSMKFMLGNVSGIVMHRNADAYEFVDKKGNRLSEFVDAALKGIKNDGENPEA